MLLRASKQPYPGGKLLLLLLLLAASCPGLLLLPGLDSPPPPAAAAAAMFGLGLGLAREAAMLPEHCSGINACDPTLPVSLDVWTGCRSSSCVLRPADSPAESPADSPADSPEEPM
jgi:hypothetical protein